MDYNKIYRFKSVKFLMDINDYFSNVEIVYKKDSTHIIKNRVSLIIYNNIDTIFILDNVVSHFNIDANDLSFILCEYFNTNYYTKFNPNKIQISYI